MKPDWDEINETVGTPYYCPTCGKELDDLLRLYKRGDVNIAIMAHAEVGLEDCFGSEAAWKITTDCCHDGFSVEHVAWMYDEGRFLFDDEETTWLAQYSGRNHNAGQPEWREAEIAKKE